MKKSKALFWRREPGCSGYILLGIILLLLQLLVPIYHSIEKSLIQGIQLSEIDKIILAVLYGTFQAILVLLSALIADIILGIYLKKHPKK